MPSKDVIFVNSSPIASLQDRQLDRHRANAFAARKAHERRRRSLPSTASALVDRNTMLARASSTAPPPALEPACLRCSRSFVSNEKKSFCRCRTKGGLALYCHQGEHSWQHPTIPPSSRPEWTGDDLSDLQFFMEVLGSSVKHYSDSPFFTIVIPCLSYSEPGIRNLVLAFTSAHRVYGNTMLERDYLPHVQTWQRCNRAIQHLASQSSTSHPEMLQASAILLACVHMLQIDMESAALYIEAATRLSGMTEDIRLHRRLDWSRHRTAEQPQHQYMQSSFASIISATIAKSATEFEIWSTDGKTILPSRKARDSTTTSAATPPAAFRREETDSIEKPLVIDSFVLRYPINDIHDLLGSLENLLPVFQQLVRNVTYTSSLSTSSTLARDLLSRFDDIKSHIRAAKASGTDYRIQCAMNTLITAKHVSAIGIQCQVLSSDPMAWDEHTKEFGELVSGPERDLTRNCDISPANHHPTACSCHGSSNSVLEEGLSNQSFVFLPFTGITVRPLFFAAVHCRDPKIRRRALAILLNHHRNESGMDSYAAGQVAAAMMAIEEGNATRLRSSADGGECSESARLKKAADIPAAARVVLRGFDLDVDTNQLVLLYSFVTDFFENSTITTGSSVPSAQSTTSTKSAEASKATRQGVTIHRHPLTLSANPLGTHGRGKYRKCPTQIQLKYLWTWHRIVGQAVPGVDDKEGKGCVREMCYDGEKVEMVLDRHGLNHC